MNVLDDPDLHRRAASAAYLRGNAYSDWILSEIPSDKDYWFVTLTMKQSIERDDGTWEPLTREAADQNVGFFEKEVNRKVFGHAYKKHQKRLVVIDAAEGGLGASQRAHRHMLIEKPERYTDAEWTFLIEKAWSLSRWAYLKTQIERANSRDAVVKYITKTGGDSICLQNTSL